MLDGQNKRLERVEIDLWNAIVVSQQTTPNLESVVSVADTLTVDEKAELVKHLLGSAPLSVVSGGNQHLSDSIVVQINMVSNSGLADVLDAVAERVRKGK